MEIEVENVRRVRIAAGRWDVFITITTADGVQQYVASADRAFTEDDGIWFGSEDEHREATARL